MATSHHLCLGCGENWITWQFAICRRCETKYGNRAVNWPRWLRESWNMEQQERRRNRKASRYETTFIDMEKDNDFE